MSETRIETDTMGAMAVPADRYWGAQTQRSLQYFQAGAGRDTIPRALIKAFGILKKSAAMANVELRLLGQDKRRPDHRGRRRSHLGQAGRSFPASHLADGLGHPDQYERQRSHQQPGH